MKCEVMKEKAPSTVKKGSKPALIDDATLETKDSHICRREILTMSQVLAILGMGKSSLYRLRKRSDFPKPFNVNARSIRWRRSEIEKWIAKGGFAGLSDEPKGSQAC